MTTPSGQLLIALVAATRNWVRVDRTIPAAPISSPTSRSLAAGVCSAQRRSRTQNAFVKTVDHVVCSRLHRYTPWRASGRRRLKQLHEHGASRQHVHNLFTCLFNQATDPQIHRQSSSSHSSAVGINFRPARIDSVALLFRDLSVLRCSVQSLCAQAHVHIVFEGRAHADGLPHEAFGLAFVEGGHDFFAAWERSG
jgi:hypothetical protein